MRGLLLDAFPLNHSLPCVEHLLRRAPKHVVHLLCERVLLPQELYRRVSGFLEGTNRSFILLQELVLDSDIVQRYYVDSVPLFRNALPHENFVLD